jgi:hypothetical protein
MKQQALEIVLATTVSLPGEQEQQENGYHSKHV